MTVKFNGFGFADEFLGKNLQFYTLMTTVDIRPSGLVAPFWEIPVFPVQDVDGNSYTSADEVAYTQAWMRQLAFDKMIEVIAERGSPIILGGVTEIPAGVPGATPDFEAAGTGGTPIYVVRFALEQEFAWRVQTSGQPLEFLPEEYLDYRLDGIKVYQGDVLQNIPSGTLPGEPYVGPQYGPGSGNGPVPEFIKDPVNPANNNVRVRRSELLPLDVDYS